MAAAQAGVITRRQALAGGLSVGAVRARLAAGRWRRIGHGLLATFSGPLPRPAVRWAAVLACGRDAVLSHRTAAELAGLVDTAEPVVHVTVPLTRRVRPRPGIVLHRSARAGTARHPALAPPRTRIEETVLDLAEPPPTSTAPSAGWRGRSRAGSPRRTGCATRWPDARGCGTDAPCWRHSTTWRVASTRYSKGGTCTGSNGRTDCPTACGSGAAAGGTTTSRMRGGGRGRDGSGRRRLERSPAPVRC